MRRYACSCNDSGLHIVAAPVIALHEIDREKPLRVSTSPPGSNWPRKRFFICFLRRGGGGVYTPLAVRTPLLSLLPANPCCVYPLTCSIPVCLRQFIYDPDVFQPDSVTSPRPCPHSTKRDCLSISFRCLIREVVVVAASTSAPYNTRYCPARIP